MNFGKIKSVLIIVLAAVNIYLGIFIFMQYRSGAIVGGEEQRLTVKLLADAGIVVSESVIPDRIPQNEIYELSFSPQDYTADAGRRILARGDDAELLTEHEELSLDTFVYRDGIKMTRGEKSVYFAVGTEEMFSFEYKKDDASTWEADLAVKLYEQIRGDAESVEETTASETVSDETADPIGMMPQDGAALTATGNSSDLTEPTEEPMADAEYSFTELKAEDDPIAEAASDFVLNAGADEKLSAEICGLYAEQSTGVKAVIVRVAFDGTEIKGHEAVLIYRDSELLYAAGTLMFVLPEQSYDIKLRDQINILFDEKDRLTAPKKTESETTPDETDAESTVSETEEDIFSADTDVKTPPETDTSAADTNSGGTQNYAYNYRITDMRIVYMVIANSAGTKVYLIPSWEIVYADGETTVRSAVSGAVYE